MRSEKLKNKYGLETGKQPNRIGNGTEIKGDITSEADFRIDGILYGTITTSGKVVIGKEGYIEGTVSCHNADIEGKFSGNLQVSGILSLRPSADIQGEVITAKLAVEPGATFNATCSMKNTSVKPLSNDTAAPQKTA